MVKGHSKLSCGVKWDRGPSEVLKETVRCECPPQLLIFLHPPQTYWLMQYLQSCPICAEAQRTPISISRIQLLSPKIKASNCHKHLFSKHKKMKHEFKASSLSRLTYVSLFRQSVSKCPLRPQSTRQSKCNIYIFKIHFQSNLQMRILQTERTNTREEAI